MNIAQLMQPWWAQKIVVIDFETTGVDPATCMPVEIACARVEGGKVVARHSQLIDPGCPIPAEAGAIHGITDEMVKDADEPSAAIRNALMMVDGYDCVPCGYNGQSYDRVVLHRFAGEDDPRDIDMARQTQWPWIDPLVVIRIVDKFIGGKGRHKLANVCARRRIEIKNAHRALADVEATAALLFHADLRKAYGDMTVLELLRRQLGHAEQQEREFQAWLAKQPPREGQAAQ